MTETLPVLLDGKAAGTVLRDHEGRLEFRYLSSWQDDPLAYPLSVSMPLSRELHGPEVIQPWLWNLLPDSREIVGGWASHFHLPPQDVFATLASVGADCAGAVCFGEHPFQSAGYQGVRWLTDADVAARLRHMQGDPSAWREDGDPSQATLAGAHPKLSLFFDGTRWGVPPDGLPTTHILKLETHADEEENEHARLDQARALGMKTARSRIVYFEDQLALAVERFDRVREGSGPWKRVHMEDMCQALGRWAYQKYERDGGPGVREIAELIRCVSSCPEQDVDRFVDGVIFNWLIGNTDAHAKNYSLLIGPGNSVRLAPLYDLTTIPMPVGTARADMRLSMAIGGETRLGAIGEAHWRRMAGEAGLEAGAVQARVADLTSRLKALQGQSGSCEPAG